MLFNSVPFLIFLPVVFIIYTFLLKNNVKRQNFLLLAASYVFYGYWDYRFLSLIAISSVADYLIGLAIYKSDSDVRKKLLLTLSLIINLGFLGFFKYYNFFIDSFQELLASLGFSPLKNALTLKIILPVGISFYTFQTLSYTIDIYRKRLKPVSDFLAFFSFVSFFPQLVAGPIERAENLLPQFLNKRTVSKQQFVDGLRQMLWGFFKKVVIADKLAGDVNFIFQSYDTLQGSVLLYGAIAFAFQIYCDFSGYSDIALGTARLFGFNLMQNFNCPYFSRNIAEFWHRWHISLSTWFRDYVFIPLGGSRVSPFRKFVNIVITFTLSGLWHGANFTFLIWGAIHSVLYLPLSFLGINKKTKEKSKHAEFKDIFSILSTFFIVTIAWVFFRAENVQHAFGYLKILFSKSLFTPNSFNKDNLVLIVILVVIEWISRKNAHPLENISKLPVYLRWGIYLTLTCFVLHFWGDDIEFIYFQF